MSGCEMIRTIAEVASAHHGNLEKLKSLTKKAAEAKFDCVKIQVFKVEELLTRDKLINSKLGENEFSREEWTEYLLWFDKNFRELGFKIILEPFGLKAFQMVQDIIKFDALKLPTSDFCDLDFARALSKKTNHLYMGIGGAYEEEIEYIMRKLKLEKDCPKISLIHGFQAYPTEISDADIWKIHYLKDKYKVDVGYACHGDAENISTRNIPSCVAIGAGATFIEKHINIKRKEKKSDYYSSLDENEYKEYIDVVKLSFKMKEELKNTSSWLRENETTYRDTMKKYACCTDNMKKGQVVKRENISMKIVEFFKVSFDKVNILIGKKVSRDLENDEAINEEDLS